MRRLAPSVLFMILLMATAALVLSSCNRDQVDSPEPTTFVESVESPEGEDAAQDEEAVESEAVESEDVTEDEDAAASDVAVEGDEAAESEDAVVEREDATESESAAESETPAASEEAAEDVEEAVDSDEVAEAKASADEASPAINPDMLKLFGALPAEVTPTEYEMSEPLVDLGRMLYYEPRLSINGQMSCNTCHGLNNYGMDGLRFSFGHSGNPVGRNSPTVYNAALHVAQFWDGRAADVEEQAKGPILAGGEMGMPSGEIVVETLKSIPGYFPYFEEAFPDEADPITYDHVGQAIGAFERRLTTPGRFDEFLAGDESALTEREQRGLALFLETGCAACHSGPALGGSMYSVLGSMEPYTTNDVGRYAVTGNEGDMHAFKVPSLRNIAVTGPYLHDGSIPTLESMVQLMVRHQLGRELESDEVDDIVTFLRALTGVLPAEYIAQPELPDMEDASH